VQPTGSGGGVLWTQADTADQPIYHLFTNEVARSHAAGSIESQEGLL
jgi:hypothetical protein